MKPLAIFVILASLMGSPSLGLSQNIEAIRERARQLEEYKQLFESEDPLLQRAALEEGLKSKDDVLRRYAFDVALDAKDPELVYLGLHALLKQRTSLIVSLFLPDEASEEQNGLYEKFHRFTLINIEVADNGQLGARGRYYVYAGAFTPQGFELASPSCGLRINGVSKNALSGSFDCGVGTSLRAEILLD